MNKLLPYRLLAVIAVACTLFVSCDNQTDSDNNSLEIQDNTVAEIKTEKTVSSESNKAKPFVLSKIDKSEYEAIKKDFSSIPLWILETKRIYRQD